MSQHTSGPWIVEEDEYSICYRIVAGEEDIGEAYMLDGKPGGPGEANARRMAAAPDLLSALDGLLREYTDQGNNEVRSNTIEASAARAAIAKATP